MTERKFYKTIIQLEILSEEPIGEREITQVIEEATTGSFSMRVMPNEETILNGEEAAKALQEQASAPSFFNLTEDGNDSSP